MNAIKSIGVFSAARTCAGIYGCLAVVLVPAQMLLGRAGFRIPGQLDPAMGVVWQMVWYAGRAAAGIVAAGISVLVCVLAGFITGAVAAWFYNFVARRFGGLEMELELAPDAPYLQTGADAS